MRNTEEILIVAEELLASWAWKATAVRPEPNRLDVYLVQTADLVPMVAALRVTRLGNLSAITGLDSEPEKGELEVLYHFCTEAAVITLRVHLSRQNPAVPTLCEIIPSAEPFERELSEMFGIQVTGLRNPAPLYLPDDWPEGVYPLRKDVDVLAILNTNGHRK